MRLAGRARRRGRDGARPLGGRGDPGLRAHAQCHARRRRQVAALALVRAAPTARSSTSWCAAARGSPSRSRRRATRRRRRGRPTGCRACRGRPAPISRARSPRRWRPSIGVVIDRQIVLPNISLVFVVPVLVAAARHGLVPSLWVSTLSVLAFNFFFLPPLYQFTIRDPANVVALFFFMFVAIAASALAARTRSQTEAARREARTTAELYAFSRKIAGVVDLYDLQWIVVTHLARLLNAEVVILMPQDGRLEPSAAFPPDSEFSDADLAAARWSWEADSPTGRGTDTLPGGALAVRADPHRPFADRRDRRAADHGGTCAQHRRAPAARRGGQPGGRRHRARDPGGRHRPGAARRRARAPALVHADLGEPRPAHAARLDHRRAVEPQEPQHALRRADARGASGHGAERGRAPRPLRRQPSGHDPARCRRHRAQARAGRCRRSRLDGAAPRRPDPAGPRRQLRGRARTCRPCRSTSCWPSRRCSTFWTMP